MTLADRSNDRVGLITWHVAICSVFAFFMVSPADTEPHTVVVSSGSVGEQRVRTEAGRVLLMARQLEELLVYEA